jgi:signal transduction histidine kinase
MRFVRLVTLLGGVLLAVAMYRGAMREDVLSPGKAVVHYAAFVVAIVAGLLVWERHPDRPMGPLLTTFAFVGASTELPVVLPASALAVTMGLAVIHLDAPTFAHATLAYPTGWLRSRASQALVTVGYVYGVVAGLVYLLFYDPGRRYYSDIWDCPSCAAPFTHVAWHDLTEVQRRLDEILVALIVVYLALLAVKIVRMTASSRRVVLPLLVVAFLLAARAGVLVYLSLSGSSTNFWTSDAAFWTETVGLFALPAALGLGVLWGRSARSAVADLVVELQRTPHPPLRDALAKTLGDPSLELGLWLPDRGVYVDAQGRPIDLPEPNSRRAVTVLGEPDAPVAALVHDPALLDQQALLRSAGAAARLALENERLQAELRLQLAEVRASRARIVGAGDEERRKLERDLHDGAQQRLLSLGLALQLVRSELGPDANGAAKLLEEAQAELGSAIEELRDLAQGIHPAVLTEHGLAPALRTLAARSAVPVELRELPAERLPPAVEAAAYFVVSEALANVAKHANASGAVVAIVVEGDVVEVEVVDDGVGGAVPRTGSGLAGLADRVHALDGKLTIESRPGGGTRLRAEIPCSVVAPAIEA